MAIQLGERFPVIDCVTTAGKLRLPSYWDNSWGLLFSYPADFTPVATTEMAHILLLMPEFTMRNVKCIALSSDTVESHLAWLKDVEAYSRKTFIMPELSTAYEDFPCPIISDPHLGIAWQLGILDAVAKDERGQPLCARAVYIIGLDQEIKMSILYPATCGHSVTEILRAIDSLQVTTNNEVATPADWLRTMDCMVLPFLSMNEAKEMFPILDVKKLPSEKPYMRITPQPKVPEPEEPEPEESASEPEESASDPEEHAD